MSGGPLYTVAGVSCRYLVAVRTVSWCTGTQSFLSIPRCEPHKADDPSFPSTSRASREPAALQHDVLGTQVPWYGRGVQASQPTTHTPGHTILAARGRASSIGFYETGPPFDQLDTDTGTDPDPPPTTQTRAQTQTSRARSGNN